MLRYFLIVLVVGFGMDQVWSANTVAIDTRIAAAITKDLSQQEWQDFRHFLKALNNKKSYRAYASIISRYLAGESLASEQEATIYRLLGIYTKLRYGGEAMAMLRDLVAIPTFKVEGQPQYQNPNIIKIGKEFEKIAAKFNLSFKNIDNRVFEVTLPGKNNSLIGIHAHVDVVPVNKALWVLKDGTKLDPFTVKTIANRMYGRGTEDDKNGIIAALYAMKVIKEEKISLWQTIRLIIDTTEETGAGAIAYYLERRPTPPYNLALDGSYPVVIAEKGYGVVMAEFPVRKATGSGAKITALTGGLATNQIPQSATATLHADNVKQLQKDIEKLAQQYIAANGSNFSITTTRKGSELILSVNGVSAHSSQPKSGINPVSRLFGFIDLLRQRIPIQANHITDAARYASDNWGLDYYGKKLNIDFEHGFMGPLTAALTFIGLDDDNLRVAVNLRVPVGKSLAKLQAEMNQKITRWQDQHKISMTVDYSLREPMYRDPKGAWVNLLLDVASENLGIKREFGSSNGGTSAHNLPNGVQFGLSMPNVKYTGHNANEFKTIDQFLIDMQIVTEAFVRLGKLKRMQ